LISRLNAADFTGWHMWAWTHHNYTDTEKDLGSGSHIPSNVSRNYARDVRQKLVDYGWLGWPDQDWTNPRLCITEGAARMDGIRKLYGIKDDGSLGPYVQYNTGGTPLRTQSDYEAKQGALITRMGNRMYNGAESAGISMVCNYLTYGTVGPTEPVARTGASDSGLLNPPDQPGQPNITLPERRRAWTSWRDLPSY
jgi:hypothetical protein